MLLLQSILLSINRGQIPIQQIIFSNHPLSTHTVQSPCEVSTAKHMTISKTTILQSLFAQTVGSRITTETTASVTMLLPIVYIPIGYRRSRLKNTTTYASASSTSKKTHSIVVQTAIHISPLTSVVLLKSKLLQQAILSIFSGVPATSSKTECMHFSRLRTDVRRTKHLLYGKAIRIAQEDNFLINYDTKVIYDKHMYALGLKCKKSNIHVLRVLPSEGVMILSF